MRQLTSSSLLIAPVLIFMALAEGAPPRAFGDTPAFSGPRFCGDGVGPCHCGDVVVTNTVLGGSDPVLRTPCPCDGLIVGPDISLEIIGAIRAEAGNGCSGIRIPPGADGAAVKAGRIVGFDIGVSVEGVTGAHIAKLLVSGGSLGISVDGEDNLVERNVVSESSAGIVILGARNEVRLNRTEATATHGVSVDGEENVVSRNLVVGSGFDGFVIVGDRAIVDRNKARANAGSGFFIIDGDGHTVSLNIAELNGFDGFTVWATTESTFTRNQSTANVDYGIQDDGDNAYVKNVCIKNGLGGSEPSGLCF